jgi:hypothetical protein
MAVQQMLFNNDSGFGPEWRSGPAILLSARSLRFALEDDPMPGMIAFDVNETRSSSQISETRRYAENGLKRFSNKHLSQPLLAHISTLALLADLHCW